MRQGRRIAFQRSQARRTAELEVMLGEPGDIGWVREDDRPKAADKMRDGGTQYW